MLIWDVKRIQQLLKIAEIPIIKMKDFLLICRNDPIMAENIIKIINVFVFKNKISQIGNIFWIVISKIRLVFEILLIISINHWCKGATAILKAIKKRINQLVMFLLRISACIKNSIKIEAKDWITKYFNVVSLATSNFLWKRI